MSIAAAPPGPSVQVERAGSVARLTMNAPGRLNAVDPPMLDALRAALAELDADDEVRVIALAGSGRAFCSGANLERPDPDGPVQVPTETLFGGGRFVCEILACRTPTVALVDGIAAGIGVSIALACDYVLVSDDAAFMLAFAKIGLMPDGGATALVAASVGRARALRMALTGEKVPGAVAADWGLASESVPAAEFAARADDLLHALSGGAPLGTAQTTAAINAATLDLPGALAREEAGQLSLMDTDDCAEGLAAFVDKRPARFTGR